MKDEKDKGHDNVHETADFDNAISLSCEATDDTLRKLLSPFASGATSTSEFAATQFPPLPPPPIQTLHPKILEKILYKKVSNQNIHGRQTNVTPIWGIQDDAVSDSGRSK